MKKIANEFKEHPISLYYCSSDIRSLDAVVIEDKKLIIVDGTAPHVFEALYPGASQEIINLGEFWDGNKLKKHSDAIHYLFDENQKYHARVRCYIEALASLNSDIYTIGAVSYTHLRREIGHGALAERALEPVLPSVEEFPYAIRLVSEVLSSNGSTSQGSICGSTLALMDAGVPIKAPVAGISCGLITKPDSDDFMTMVDIQGLEDFFGDMDFKVGGTHKGITAIQVDIKVDGLTPEIIKEAFEKTRKARLYILDEIMLKAIPESRATVNKYAPKMIQTKIDVCLLYTSRCV